MPSRIDKQIAKAEAEMNAAAARLDKAQAQYDAATALFDAYQKLAKANSGALTKLLTDTDAQIVAEGIAAGAVQVKPNGGRGTLEEQAKAGRKVLVENVE